MRTLPLLLVAACAGSQASAREARRIQARLASGDTAGAVQTYRAWRASRGSDDRAVLRAFAKATLWQAIGSPSAEVRGAAIVLAEKLDLEEMGEAVARRLEDDDARVRATAAVALLGAHPDAPTVLAELLDGPDADARVLALTGLSRKAGKHARREFQRALDDPDARVRAAACDALHADASSADALLAVAGEDREGSVRAAALRAVRGRRHPRTARVAEAALNDPYLGARLAALEWWGAHEGAEARRTILTRAADGADLYVALRAEVLARRKGARPPSPALDKALASAEGPLRAAALNAVAEILPPGAATVSLAAARAGDPDPLVRLAAARALIRLGRAEPGRAILLAALAASPDAKLQAAVDLARLGDARGVAALTELAASGEPVTRRQAIEALPVSRSVPDALVGALADPSGLVRLAAAARLLGG